MATDWTPEEIKERLIEAAQDAPNYINDPIYETVHENINWMLDKLEGRPYRGSMEL